MAIQIKPGRLKEQRNGLVDIEDAILDEEPRDIVSVVTYRLAKRVEDVNTGERYPVIEVRHIEPLLTAEAVAAGRALQATAYKERTGEAELDFGDVQEPASSAFGDDDEDGDL